MQALVMQERAFSPNRPIRLVQHWEMRDADERFVGFLQRHEYAPKPIPADKVARAVDRVDDPSPSARPVLAGAFLAEDAVVREPTVDRLTNETLILFIGNCDRRRVRLR